MSLSKVVVRSTIRNFSARAPKPETDARRFIAGSALVSAFVLPFIPPALESSRLRKNGNNKENKYPPLCFRSC